MFCELIYKQIIAVNERAQLITFDLARGPGGDEENGWTALHSLSSSTPLEQPVPLEQ